MRLNLGPGLAALAACIISIALQWTNGHYRASAIPLIALAWIIALVSVLGNVRARSPVALVPLLGAIVATNLALLATEPPTVEMVVRNPAQLLGFQFLLVVVAVMAGIGMATRSPRVEKLWFPAIVLMHIVMAAIVLGFVQSPMIDVWTVQMESAKALLSGENPYGIKLTDPYGGTSSFFPPGASIDGKLQFGFVYPPLVLLLCLPGYVLGGDTRWSGLVATALAAVLIGYARPGKTAKLAAIAFLFMPRTFFVIDRAWSDPFVVLLTAAVAFTALRAPRWAFVPIGLFVCLKQHTFIGVPALFLLVPRPIPWRPTLILAAKAAGVAGLVTLPLVLWGPHAFARSVLDIREVFRVDSLGFIAFLHNTGTVTLSKWAGLGAIIPVMVLGLLRAPRTVGGFALLAGLTHLSLYVWSTHSFCNEYYNVVGALFCGVATWGRPSRLLEGMLEEPWKNRTSGAT